MMFNKAKVITLILSFVLLTASISTDTGAIYAAKNAKLSHNTPLKHAYINGSSVHEDGSQNNHVVVKTGDSIRYTVDVTNAITQGAGSSPKYDVLFLLDWSTSMQNGYMDTSRTQTAMAFAKNIMVDISNNILNNYPDSRVALIGMNSSVNNSIHAYDAYIQMQTDFMDKTAWSSFNPTAVFTNPSKTNDSNAVFLGAAVDTMLGLKNSYGGVYTIPRTEPDERIPIIVHISDFQMFTDGTMSQQWGIMKGHANRFKAAYPKTVLMGIRLDHSGNINLFDTAAADTHLKDNLTGNGAGLFTKVPQNTTYKNTLQTVLANLNTNAPNTSPLGTIVKDKVPEGLIVDTNSISHGGVYDPVTRTITWDLTDKAAGNYTLEFTTTVKDPGTFENTANAKYSDGTEDNTNTTHHKTARKENKLHLRQIVISYTGSTELPYTGFFDLVNDGKTLSVTTDSNRNGVNVDFREFLLGSSNNDKVYLINDILPQNYEYAGYISTTSDTIHDPAQRINTPAAVDYTNENEYWVTVYIKPQTDPIGKTVLDFKANDFGEIKL